MKFDEAGPIARDRINADVDGIRVLSTEWNVHGAKPIHTCRFDLPSAKLLVRPVESEGDMKTVGEARVMYNFFIHGNLCKIQVLPGYRIRSFG